MLKFIKTILSIIVFALAAVAIYHVPTVKPIASPFVEPVMAKFWGFARAFQKACKEEGKEGSSDGETVGQGIKRRVAAIPSKAVKLTEKSFNVFFNKLLDFIFHPITLIIGGVITYFYLKPQN